MISKTTLSILFICCIASINSAPTEIEPRGQLCKSIIGINACVSIYPIDAYNVRVEIKFGGVNIYSGSVKVNGATPICGSALGFKVCFDFYTTPITGVQLNVCIKGTAAAPFVGATDFNLGCLVV